MADAAWPGMPYDPKDATALKALGNAVRGHEGGGPGVTSPQGAGGSGQIIPKTFNRYAMGGERLYNDQDNIRVSDRIIRDLYYRHGKDPARVATGYFSGEGNIAPAGSRQPYRANTRDVNEPVSAYVQNVEKRMPQQWPGKPLQKATAWPGQPFTHDRNLGRLPPRTEQPQQQPSAPRQQPASVAGSPNEQLRIDLGLKTPGQIQAEPFAADPSIAARVKQQPGQIDTAVKWIKQNYPDLQIADMMGDLTNWATGKGQDALESAFTKAGVPNAGRAARDLTQYVTEFMPLQSGLGRMGFRPPTKLPGEPAVGEPGTGVPYISGEPAASPSTVVPFPHPKYEPVPGGTIHPPEEPPTATEAPPPPPAAKATLGGAIREFAKDETGAIRIPFMQTGGPPLKPGKDWIRFIEDGFQKVRGGSTADRAQIRRWVKTVPKEVRDPAVLGRLFAYGEGDRSVNLTPRERQYFDRYIQPMRDENRQGYNRLASAGIKDDSLDPDHMHRAVKGKTREYDPYTGFGSEETPVVGYKSTRPSAVRTRQYWALEDGAGNRQVIHHNPTTGQVSTVSGGKFNPIKLDQVPKRGGGTKAPDIRPGESVTMGGQSYTIKNALTREIEANTSTRYYKNALASVIRANIQLKSANRLLDFLRDIKQTPEFQEWAKPRDTNLYPQALQLEKEGWRTPRLGDMPIFREFIMHPTLAGALEDFYGSMPAKNSLVEMLYKVTRFAVQSMFWSPLVHASNAGFHWATARGIDWVNPMGYKRLASTLPRAIYEVSTQGPKYQSLLRQGSGLVYGGLAQRDFFEHVLKAVGENVQRHPAKWDPIARILGVGPSTLIDMIYTGSAKGLWWTSDVLMVQRVLELEQKGMGTAEAIAEAEKHLPNYRIPTEVMGQRWLAQGLKNVGLTEFSRYHYGMIKSVAHMARDLVSPKATMKERYEALGSIMMTGVLMAIVTPFISKKLQELTGDKDIEYSPKGSTVIPEALWNIFVTHKGNPFDFLNRIITINPVIKTAIEAAENRDMFTGHNIVSPSDLARHPGRFAAKEADFFGKNIVSPYGTLVEGMKHGLKGLPEQILKQGVGARKTPRLYESRTEERYQEGHKGPIEKTEDWMYRYLQSLKPSYGGVQ